MMADKLYAAPVTLAATFYVKAENKADARRKTRALTQRQTLIFGETPMRAMRMGDPERTLMMFSPAMRGLTVPKSVFVELVEPAMPEHPQED